MTSKLTLIYPQNLPSLCYLTGNAINCYHGSLNLMAFRYLTISIFQKVPIVNSALLNGDGWYAGGPTTALTLISVEQ